MDNLGYKVHKATELLKLKGWTVELACEWWDISTKTYYRWVNSPKYEQRLIDMCKGLEER